MAQDISQSAGDCGRRSVIWKNRGTRVYRRRDFRRVFSRKSARPVWIPRSATRARS